MHFAFFPYGGRAQLENMFRDMEAQKFKWKMVDPNTKKESYLWVQGQLRVLPFGVWEYIAPKEAADIIMTTLKFHVTNHGHNAINMAQKAIFKVLRKILRLKSIPTFKTDHTLLWVCDNVAIIPLGVRADLENWIDPINNLAHEQL